MKKLYPLLICFLFTVTLSSQNNTQKPYLSELYESILSKSVNANLDTKTSYNIYTTYDSAVLVMNRRAFEDKNKKGYAKISKFNIISGTEDAYYILPSSDYMAGGGNLNHIWIWALAASDSLLFIAVDEEIWVYRLSHAKQFEYLKTISLKEVTKLGIANNNLHAFVENKQGFDWYKINLANDEITHVRKLELKNPLLLQIIPVQVIAIANNALYLLQQNTPSIEKYALSGEFLSNHNLTMPNWNRIPEEITQHLDSIEDMTERSYAIINLSVFTYHFMHLFYVFPSERFFMIAIDENKGKETYITPYFIQIVGDTTIVEPYAIQFQENEKYGAKYFPFLSPRAEGNLLFAQLNEYIVQINLGTTVPWKNKTQKEYQREVNLYHRDHEPIEKMETYRFIKNHIPADSIRFLDYDDHIFSLNDMEKEKAIFIISQNPQCATCIKVLWNYFSQLALSDTELYTIIPDCSTYLLKKEKIKEINSFLKSEYTPLFIESKKLNSVTKRTLTQKTNPIVLLFDKRLQHIEIISAHNIIDEVMGNLTPSFIQTITNFINN